MPKMKREPNEFSVLLNLSDDLLTQIDYAAEQLECSRTHFLRQSIRRNLEHFKKCELPVLIDMKRRRYQFEAPSEIFSNAY